MKPSAFLQDLDRYRWNNPRMPRWIVLLIMHGAQASFVYRLGHWIYTSKRGSNPLWWVMLAAYYLMRWFVQVITGISISPHAEIGPGLYIGHFGCIFIGGQVSIGNNCNISHEVTIGAFRRNLEHRSPQIGDRVYFAPGSKVFGDIEIGDDAAIGANAVVPRSVPPRAVMGGIPAKKISSNGSFDLVSYFNMDKDPDRIESLNKRENKDGSIS